MICPNCKSDTVRYTTVVDDNGNPFIFCPYCPRPKEPEFPALMVKGGGRKKKAAANLKEDKFKRFEVSPQEMKMNREMARKGNGAIRRRGSPLDEVPKFQSGERVEFFVGGSGVRKQEFIDSKIRSAFARKGVNVDGYDILSYDGFRGIAEVKH